ncbi:parallel beta helix pectate lyase-like protein [Herbihabitans rhizosphaerae]|uniref:Parallel beta helix pectate lyase-like protein n=1 Tax=Herbihabitans rhizosphaerae TaxID=1872711 RepID=A0A4Q7L3J3_9PSEU|nr:right-handed parallel beta-helix repeat-containing protein [Herbihabitans rhizosphaerae]RZS44178.1 parallel beta helix pectate lyase-like protein [Herbihabitans rhizosphaerae]
MSGRTIGIASCVAVVLAVIAATVGSAEPVPGRTLTVGPNGEYQTIQAAADAAEPGDTVSIEPGTYDGGLSITKSGSSGKPITFKGEGGTVVVTGDGGGDNGLIALGNNSWLRFSNITSTGSRGFGVYGSGGHDLVFENVGVNGSQDGGLVLLGTSRVLVDGCEIQGTNAEGTGADHEALSIGSGSSDVEVRRCAVHDNGEEGIDVKDNAEARARIHDNKLWNNRGPNIYVASSSFVDVYNNVVSAALHETKPGILVGVEDYSEIKKVDNLKVYNNVSHGNAQAGLAFWVQSSGTMSNIQIVNNTFHGNRSGSIAFGDETYSGENILRNNIYGEGDSVAHGDFVSDHNTVGDPGFVDPAAGDFRLKDGSSAIDTGSGSAAPAFDLDNKPRPAGGGHDIGAYER